MELQKILVSLGYSPENYTGRGMYGKTCVAIRTEGVMHSANLVLSILQDKLENETTNPVRETLEEILDLIGVLQGIQQDNMGRGMIFYWPNIKFDES